MMSHTQDERYFTRMASSLGDKAHLLSHLRGHNVLDVGAGGGELSQAVRATGRRALALDGSLAAVRRMREAGGAKMDILHGQAHEVTELFPADWLDSVLCSSIFHEVYSYGTLETGPYSQDALSLTLSALHTCLRPNGHLIIRDGIMPSDWDRPVKIKFASQDGMDFLDRYRSRAPFASWAGSGPRCVRLENTEEALTVEGNLASAMEFLYTYTWGWDSAEREMKELYGLFTQADYCTFVEAAGFEVESCGEYLQPGYYEHLSPLVELLNADGSPCPYPASNFVMVARKV